MKTETYKAQGDKLYSRNPRGDEGLVEVATCVPVNDLHATAVAGRLASRLNYMSNIKDRAQKKDDLLDKAVSWLFSIDSKEIPAWFRETILEAYEV